MTKYHDIETDEILTYSDLSAEWERLYMEHNTECTTAEDYIKSCLQGTLEKIK